MTFDEFATIMAMYPTTPTDKLSSMFGIHEQTIKVMANACGVHKAGRNYKPKMTTRTVVTYDARTAQVGMSSTSLFKIRRSIKPVKLQLRWEEL